MSKQRSSGPHRRILVRLCALALIAAMLLTSAYAGGAVESGPAVESLATENLAAENLAPQSAAPSEGAEASSTGHREQSMASAAAAAAATAEDIATTAPVDASPTQAAQPSTAVESTTAAASTAPASTQSSAGITTGVSQTTTPTEKPTGPVRAPQAPAPLAEEDPVYSLTLGPNTISNVTAFYPAESLPISTNSQWCILGLYYDAEHQAHILLGLIKSGASQAEDKLGNFHVNNSTFQMGTYEYEIQDGSFSSIVLQNDQGATVDSISTTSRGTTGYFDLTVGDIDIGNSFSISMDGTAGGWQIDKIDVTLDLDYTLTKQVAKGSSAGAGVTFAESVTVDRGDYVIYKITVANKGKLPLQEMLLQDILPKDVFVKDSIRMGVGDPNGNIPNWTPFDDDTLFDDYSSPGEFTRDVYITAQVKPDLNISTPTTYTNTATIDGMSMPTLEDSADIIVNPPTPGTLRVSKQVKLENPLDTAPDTSFNFTLTYNGQTTSFLLKDQEDRTFTIPANVSYTVSETPAPGYITSVNGNGTTQFTGTMAEGGSPVVVFVNQLSAKTISLNIKKIDADKNDPLQGAQFALYPAVEKDGEWVAKPDAEPITPSYLNGGNSTGEDGLATFSVQLGNYLLYEVKAPSGYRLLTDPVRITVADGKVTYYVAGNNEGQTVEISNLAATVSVPNSKQDELPVAGGMGAIWFSAGGLALASAAALLYFKQRKKGEE